eukprot:1150897-Pelagomonas_calceolata.AAC.2
MKYGKKGRAGQLPNIAGHAQSRFSFSNLDMPTLIIPKINDENRRTPDHSPGLRSPKNGPQLHLRTIFHSQDLCACDLHIYYIVGIPNILCLLYSDYWSHLQAYALVRMLQVFVASKFDNRLKEFAERWEVDKYLAATGYLPPKVRPFFVALPKVLKGACLIELNADPYTGIGLSPSTAGRINS